MIREISIDDQALVSGGDDITNNIGRGIGWALAEIREHPIGAMFGVTGIVIAHYFSE